MNVIDRVLGEIEKKGGRRALCNHKLGINELFLHNLYAKQCFRNSPLWFGYHKHTAMDGPEVTASHTPNMLWVFR